MNVAVYCGSSSDDIKTEWQLAATAVGQWIGSHQASLIYGGVDRGLMKIVADESKKAGANLVGIVPMRRRDTASPLNDVEVPTSDLNDRKGVMQLLADVFVVLPGGYGTLDEFTTSFSYLNFTQHYDRTIIVFNPDHYYDHLLKLLESMVESKMMQERCMSLLEVVTTPAELTAALDGIFTTKGNRI